MGSAGVRPRRSPQALHQPFTPLPIGRIAILIVLLTGLRMAPGAAWAQASSFFSDRPAWLCPEVQQTTSVAFGDIDGDGDLDLVCGRVSEGSEGAMGAPGAAVYRNLGGTFTETPVWTSERADSTWSVALVDVDKDGDLDLVCGNHPRSKIYQNDDGTLTKQPVWISPIDMNTRSVALADVDGDGDVDLVCGNYGQNYLFRNRNHDPGQVDFGDAESLGGTSTLPSTSIALADVDSDHRVDLICGNYGATEVYRGNGWSFESRVLWASNRDRDDTRGIALGDISGDGLLDLICGNKGPSTAFLNQGNTFPFWPDWVASSSDDICLVLGDVDGDGDLDLISGTSLGASKIYLNVGGALADPIAATYQGGSTNAVALGDVDGDGDLDLVCGQTGQSVLYLNSRLAFERAPTEFIANQTNAVALGDIDGDGDLDLLSAGMQSIALHRNEGGRFVSTSWSPAVCVTGNLALGDIDHDGDLDLMSGFGGHCYPALYRNEGGRFLEYADWNVLTSTWYVGGTLVEFGDIDGDGFLDLVIAGAIAEGGGVFINLYLNDHGTFGSPSLWGPEVLASCLALGDVDGDGDLDLVCGRSGAPTLLFANDRGMFQPSPSWSTARSWSTRSVALGDVDGDGDLDLVCGNDLENSTLYRNEGGTLSTAPVWYASGASRTASVALADVDADGDLDLVCGNYNQPPTIYFNLGGELERYPSWIADHPFPTTSIALGDVDNDGDLDLVCGNYNQSASYYAGLVAPPFRGDPTSPRNQLPNSDAFLRNARIDSIGENRIRVQLEAVDVDSDPVWIVPEWQYRGVPQWHPVDVFDPTELGPIEASPAGRPSHFTWDTSKMPVDPRAIVLRLRTISPPVHGGVQNFLSPYLIDVGPVDVRRAAIEISPSPIVFPAVTVGDTVTATFEVVNRGSERLTVQGITLPALPLELEAVIPLHLEPAERDTLILHFGPRALPTESDTLWVESNDPETPHLGIAIRNQVHPLAFTARLVTALPEVPLGQAVSAILTPTSGVRVERAEVHYRPAGSSLAFESAPLGPSSSEFVGYIPDSGVTEAGIEYAFEAENSGVVATYPEDGSTLLQAVQLPETFVVRPLANSPSGFLDGTDIEVEVSPPDGASFVSGILHYRRGGERAYQADSLIGAPRLASGTIPNRFVGARGVHYWVELQTTTRTLTVPRQDPENGPLEIQPSVRNLAEGVVHPGERYRLLTVPLEFGPGFTGNLATLLADEGSFGPFNPAQWRLFRYLPSTGQNVEMTSAGDPVFRPEPGRAFWVISRSSHAIDTAPAGDARATPASAPYPLVLEPGWNAIGSPFAFPVSVADIEFSTGVESLTAFDPHRGATGDYAPRPVRVLEPFEGYFVYNDGSQNPATLLVHPREALVEFLASPASREAGRSETSRPSTLDSWVLRLQLRSASAVDGANLVGVRPDAETAFDGFDLRKPPSPPGAWAALGFPHSDWGAKAGLYRHDVRAPDADGHLWQIQARSAKTAEELVIEPLDAESLPHDLQLRLVDTELGVVTDLRRSDGTLEAYHFLSHGPDRPYHLLLLAGTETWLAQQDDGRAAIPADFVLDLGAPNPFTSAARIRFGLPQPERVNLFVYNIRGERVAWVIRNEELPAGYQSRLWNGRDDAGRSVANGVYFCRLSAGPKTLIVRLIRLK